jgi:serine/threonine protein kinase
LIGQTLSHFQITAKLGEGGMGEVYRADDTQLRREVALKVLPQELAGSQERLERFRREAEVLASLDHPNIVTIYSVEEDHGVHFLTMQLVEGKSLAELIPEKGLPLEQILDISVSLADALRAANDRGVVHRDLKPANVMVDGEGRVKILDFGLAKLRQRPDDPDLSLLPTAAMTQEGVVLGTIPYMSPEQVQGFPVDHRTDLFSFGILLYEMITGQRPFDGNSSAAVAGALMRDSPKPAAELRSALPEALLEILERCLEKDPDLRYQSAEEVRSALEEVQLQLASGRVASARPRSPKRYHLRSALVAVVSLVVVLAGFALWRWMIEPSVTGGPVIDSLVVLPLKNLSGDPEQEYFVDGMTEALITDLSKISALKVISRSSSMRYRDSDKPLADIARELEVEAVVEGSVQREGERVGITAQLIEAATDRNLWADRYERDVTSILRLQGEIARAIAAEVRIALTPEETDLLSSAQDVDPQAHEAYLRGMFHLRRFTPQDFQTALQNFDTALEIDPDNALAHYGISQVWNYSFVLGVVQPRQGGPKALEAVKRALELDENLAEAHLGLANIKTSYEWDWQGAEKAFLRAIEINPNYAEARVFYSHLLLILGRIDEGRAQIARGLELDPLEPFFRAAYGVLLSHSGHVEDGIDIFHEVFETTPGFGFAHQPFWRALHFLGRYEEALEQARIHLENVGEVEAATAMERGYAEAGYQEAMRRAADVLAAGSGVATARPIIIAALYDDAGDRERTLEWIEKGYEIRDIDMAYLGTLLLSHEVRSDPRFLEVLDRLGTPLIQH